MVIAIQRGLNSIYEGLRKKGFKVVFADECKHPVDVMIYNGFVSYHPLSVCADMSFQNSLAHGSSINSAVIEINAEGKSLSDIETLIASKRQNICF